MKLAYVQVGDERHVVIGHRDEWRDTGFSEPLMAIRRIAEGTTDPAALFERGAPLNPERFLAPVPRPGKVVCCGINYSGHLEENPEATLPQTPFFFAKLPTSIVGPDEPIVLPQRDSQIDWEVELAFVIGRAARGVTRDTAMEHVLGYTLVNDVSARDIQFTDSQITLGKGYDSFCPMGPHIVLADELTAPDDVTLSSYVNGERMQHDHTGNWLFTIPDLIESLSRYITLEPGDIITTGTPAGVGLFQDPPRFLTPGDVVTLEADGIGRLENPTVASWETTGQEG